MHEGQGVAGETDRKAGVAGQVNGSLGRGVSEGRFSFVKDEADSERRVGMVVRPT